MQLRLELQKSLGRVGKKIAHVEAAKKQGAALVDLEQLVPNAKTMYEDGRTSHHDFTKDKCKALLSVVFYVSSKKSDKKDELVKLLETATDKNTEKLTAAAENTSNNDAPVTSRSPEIETDLPSSPSQSLSTSTSPTPTC
jgi:hypothetical protein